MSQPLQTRRTIQRPVSWLLGFCMAASNAWAQGPAAPELTRPLVLGLVTEAGAGPALTGAPPMPWLHAPIAWVRFTATVAPARVAAGPVPRMPDPYRALFHKIARETRVPVALIAAVAAAESGFDPLARSPKGATGLMQLMPDTARRFNVTDLLSPEDNLRGGANYLRWLTERFANDMERVIAAYNAGEGAVEKAGGTPPFQETQEYLPKVLRYLQHFDKAMPEKAVAGARRV